MVQQLQRYCNHFAVLLAQLAPKRWKCIATENTLAVYYELLDVCSGLFPIFEAVFYSDEDPDDGDPIDERLEFGIPIELLGLNDDVIEFGTSPTWGFVGYLMEPIEGRRKRPAEFPRGLGKSWRNIVELRPLYDAYIERKWIHAPRGREWRGIWKPLTALAEYVMHDTGNWMLDVSNQAAAEDYGEAGYPPWTIEDVRNCAREYQRAKPILKAIEALRGYVDERPGERLPVLAAALTGDAEVRRQISRPKRAKTLAEVWR